MWIIYEAVGKTKKAIGAYSDEEQFEEAWKNGNDRRLNISFEQLDSAVSAKKLAPPDYKKLFIDAVNKLTEAQFELSVLDFSKVAQHIGETDYKEIANKAINVLSDENLIVDIAEPYRMYVDLGDYGYGRSLEWSTSDGVVSGTWVSSSANC